MTERKKILLIITLIALTFGAYRLNRFFSYDFHSPELATFESPDGTKSAYLLWHGTGRLKTLTLLASKNLPLDDILWIDSFDEHVTFNELLWSTDSSLVAARCYVHYAFPEGTKEFLLTHAYDFESLDRFALQRDLSDLSAKELINWDNKLEQLFTQKGGQQSCVSKDNLHDHMRKLKWREWRQWRTRLSKAKKQEANK
ncbi:MAG: hypothetical protein ACYSW0_11730 [Planctomycetota bacterium]|jgi:hypothetical protein